MNNERLVDLMDYIGSHLGDPYRQPTTLPPSGLVVVIDSPYEAFEVLREEILRRPRAEATLRAAILDLEEEIADLEDALRDAERETEYLQSRIEEIREGE